MKIRNIFSEGEKINCFFGQFSKVDKFIWVKKDNFEMMPVRGTKVITQGHVWRIFLGSSVAAY